jgi:hypothetical protein
MSLAIKNRTNPENRMRCWQVTHKALATPSYMFLWILSLFSKIVNSDERAVLDSFGLL